MTNLAQIKKQVNQRVNESNREIVSGLMINLIQFHNSFCSCDYCLILRKYVKCKKTLSRVHKAYINPVCLDDTREKLLNPLELKSDMKNLKARKNQLKLSYLSRF